MDAEPPRLSPSDGDRWSDGLDRTFFSRVYKRAAQIGVVVTLMALGLEQREVALGLLSGLAMGLFSTWTLEATAKLLFRGGSFSGMKLAIAALVKMPLMLGALMGIAWACFNRHMNAFAVIGGLLLMHATMLVMVIGMAVAAQDSNRNGTGDITWEAAGPPPG